MDKELQDLKSVLRSLVVSSPSQMDVRSLQRDYRNMMGSTIPIGKFGYRDMLTFLRERCGDSFQFQEMSSNPILTLIVPDSLKHIDQFVQRQKATPITKMKGKRRSVPESVIKPKPEKPKYENRPKFEGTKNLIYETFIQKSKQHISNHHREHTSAADKNEHLHRNDAPSHNVDNTNDQVPECKPSYKPEDEHRNAQTHEEEYNSHSVRDFLRKRLPACDSSMFLNSEDTQEPDKGSSKNDDDSGRQTSSSRSSTKRAQLEELKTEIYELIKEQENGVLCTDLLKLYRERYGRELNLNRVGVTNLTGVLSNMRERVVFSAEAGGTRVRDVALPSHSARVRPRAGPCHLPHASNSCSLRALPVDSEDALPGVDFDPDVFPSDCMHYMESIPALDLSDMYAGAMVEVTVGEVYSPSHFWIQRLGDSHSQVMHALMDHMSVYYNTGPGRSRVLAVGAVCPGHYCASLYDGDWHRSLIIKIVDADTVKVRHVDYGTVDTVSAHDLKPLVREFATRLPAQAARARLAGLRPPAAARRWPRSAAAYFLNLVRDTPFIANVAAVDPDEDTIETFLIDTRAADDLDITTEMIESGHAEPRPDSALRTGECYLYPTFSALESGDTLNYAEIHQCLADGISLEFVEAYRRHVPATLLARPPPPSPSPPSRPVTPAPACSPRSMFECMPSLRLDSPPPVGPQESAVLPSLPAKCTQWAGASSSARESCLSPSLAVPVSTGSKLSPTVDPFVPLQLSYVARYPPGLATCSRGPTWQNSQAPAVEPGAGQPPPVSPWGEVRLSLNECEMYRLLSVADPTAAHCYMLTTLQRATGVSYWRGPPRP